jgi:HAD superfamily 5'-nucleotidase-like hydrolase
MPDLLAFHSAQRPDRLWPLNTWFDVSAAHMLALLVDRCDRQHPQADAAERARLYREVFVDMVAGFELGFSEYDKGWYFPALARVSEAGEAVGDFVFRRPEVVAWLQRLRRAGRRLFLVTNSKLDYATLLCNYALGREWQQLFDVVVVQANKGQFFTERRPFRLTDPATLATSPVEVAPAELRVGAVYALGNSADLHALFERESGAGARVAYFGDHLNTDVMCAARFTPWLPVAVVEELEQFTGPARPDVTPLRDSLDFGSYFFTPAGRRTFWFDHLLRHAALVVPDVAWLAEVDLERRFAFRAAEPLCCVAEPRPTRRDADEAAREAVRGGGGVSA